MVFLKAVPEEYDGFCYVWRGSGYLGAKRRRAEKGQLALFDKGSEFRMEAGESSELRVLLIAGVPLNELIARHGLMQVWCY